MGNADALSRLPVDKAPEEHENTILLIKTHSKEYITKYKDRYCTRKGTSKSNHG